MLYACALVQKREFKPNVQMYMQKAKIISNTKYGITV